MPYISPEAKARLETGERGPLTPGELNYVLTSLCLQYLQDCSIQFGYMLLNDVMGALTGAQAEFYRRVVAPYEDRKCAENGDVYEGWTSE